MHSRSSSLRLYQLGDTFAVMSATETTARLTEIAAGQWGMLTTAQAQAEGISRLQLSRLADAGVLERVSQGIYALPANVDARTDLRAAWLALDPKTMAEDRLEDPATSGVISHTSAASLHGLGDLLDDTPEITVASRKQSRRGTRLHRATLDQDEVTLAYGLPTTTPARTAADLLHDGHDPTHVAEIVGEALQQGLASRHAMETALEPLAAKFDQDDGASLLEHLLDMVGLSTAALTAQLASSELGKSLIAASQVSALQRLEETVAELQRRYAETTSESTRKVLEKLTEELRASTLPQVAQPVARNAQAIMSFLDPQVLTSPHNANVQPSLMDLARSINQIGEHGNADADSSGATPNTEDS